MCRYCYIEDFLIGPACNPFLCLRSLNEEMAFNRSISYLASVGEETGVIIKWIDKVLCLVDGADLLM